MEKLNTPQKILYAFQILMCILSIWICVSLFVNGIKDITYGATPFQDLEVIQGAITSAGACHHSRSGQNASVQIKGNSGEISLFTPCPNGSFKYSDFTGKQISVHREPSGILANSHVIRHIAIDGKIIQDYLIYKENAKSAGWFGAITGPIMLLSLFLLCKYWLFKSPKKPSTLNHSEP